MKLKTEKTFLNRFDLDFELIFETLGNMFSKIILSKQDIIKIADQDFDKDLQKLTKTDYEELIENLLLQIKT